MDIIAKNTTEICFSTLHDKYMCIHNLHKFSALIFNSYARIKGIYLHGNIEKMTIQWKPTVYYKCQVKILHLFDT